MVLKKIFEGFYHIWAILVMWPGTFEQIFIPTSQGGSIWNLASNSLVFFWEWMTLTLGCHNSSVTHLFDYMYTYIHLRHRLQSTSHAKIKETKFDLPCKIGQGQPRVIICSNLVVLKYQCRIPSFKVIGLLVPEKLFKGFYRIWTWRPSWSCDIKHLYSLSFPHPT